MNTTKSSIASIVSGAGTISLYVRNRAFTVRKDNPNYAAVKEALNDNDEERLLGLLDVKTTFETASKGTVTLDNGEVMFNGKPVHNTIVTRIKVLVRDGFPFEPMARFLENVLANPDQRAVDELYLFLEHNSLPITPEGNFLAYKRINADFRSFHKSPDGTHLDHSIGKVVEMPREEVDKDRHQTCSSGLHFCSLPYLKEYNSGCGLIVVVSINPADVVSIPSDYNNQKGRACKYTVIAEKIDGETVEQFTKPIVESDGSQFGIKPSGHKYWQVRDENGKFVKAS